jgi:hypothetical protein
MNIEPRPFPAWTEREMSRFAFRVSLFKRHGMTEPRAEEWADRLFERDHERDDRRSCVECANLVTGWRCVAKGAVLPDTLQRCPAFVWAKPKK